MNNRFVLRKENFGGLLFDRIKLEAKVLDKEGFERLLKRGISGTVIQGNNHTLVLSAPTKIFLVLTKKCGLSCIHCSAESDKYKNEELSYREIENILLQLDRMGVFEIGLIGGEPLFHPQFFEIVQLIKQMGFPLHLNTNGIAGKENLDRLSKSKIDVIKVSIDGLQKNCDRIRGKHTFKKAINTVKFLKKTGNCVKINCTLTRQNQGDLLGMITLADELECGIKFAPMIKVGRAKNLEENVFSVAEGEVMHDLLRKFCKDKGIRIQVEIVTELVAKDCLTSLSMVSLVFTRCGSSHLHMIIDSDGVVYNTGCQTEISPTRALGNIQKQSIPQLWENANKMNEERRNRSMECSKCNIEDLIINSFERFNKEI